MPSVQLSAVIITLNEERNIARCLDSLAGIADDIVIVDAFSTDQTLQICREKGARVLQRAFTTFSDQKNYALQQAQYFHVFSIDADEALSETLQASMRAVKADWQCDAYQMNRCTNYCGQWIRHSGWYPDRKLRLFDRRKGQWGGPNPHERLEMDQDASIGFLKGDLLHYSYYSVTEHLRRARYYASLGARHLYAEGKKGLWMQVIFSPLAKFVRNYIFRRGFLDGRAGWTICYIAALETYWKYRALIRLRGLKRG